jgi:hypothetical protein
MTESLAGSVRTALRLVRNENAGGEAGAETLVDTGESIWSDMASTLRERLGLDPAIDDDAIAHSLAEINRFDDIPTRWQAAFDSTLGLWLALKGLDLEAALAPLVTAAPARA